MILAVNVAKYKGIPVGGKGMPPFPPRKREAAHLFCHADFVIVALTAPVPAQA